MLFSHDTKADALAACPFFEGLSRNELLEIAKVTEDLEVEAGKALTREGQSGSEFFVIVPTSGKGELAGITGTGGMAIDDDGTHRIWFDYELAGPEQA